MSRYGNSITIVIIYKNAELGMYNIYMFHRNLESEALNQGFNNLGDHLRISTFAFLCTIGQFIRPVILER